MVATALRDARSRYRRHLAGQRRRVDEFSRRTGIATTVHEATHQLLFHTGVQSRSVQYPLWICEGLATAFETDDPGSAFGPDREYVERRERFDELLAQGPLLPLRRLVTIADMHSHDDAVVDALYNQSYALVTWMFRFRRRELQAYLTTMRDQGSGQPSPSKQLQLFQQAFGDIDRLERAWLAHERSRRSVHR